MVTLCNMMYPRSNAFNQSSYMTSLFSSTSEGVGDGDAERARTEHGDGPGGGERPEAEGAEGQAHQEPAHRRRRLGHRHRRGGRVPARDAHDGSRSSSIAKVARWH